MDALQRRYDIDWIRVIAIGLLLIYHIAICFQPWATFIMFMKSNETMESIWIPMSMLNIWRIPLLFFVSGMGVCFAIKRRNWLALIKERTQRILVPFLFGMVAIVPLHIFFMARLLQSTIDLHSYSISPVVLRKYFHLCDCL
jgi:glucan biosynthesis protein C